MPLRLLITGSSGFIGINAVEYFDSKLDLTCLSLRDRTLKESDFLKIDAVLFLTGIAHTTGIEDERLYYKVNCDLAVECALAAKDQGVKQFIYLSSSKVYGSICNEVVDENSFCNPTDPYGLSKYKAEKALMKLSCDKFHVKIIRPPLVYGKGVKANFRKIIQLAKSGLVIPLKHIDNKRSMIYVLNLIHFIEKLLKYNYSGIYLTSDIKPYSSSEIVEFVLNNQNRFQIYFSIPRIVRILIKKYNSSLYSKLFDSFEMDASKSHRLLNYTPPYEMSKVIDELC